MQIMNTKEVSAYLHINEKKIYQLVKDSQIPFTRVGGKIIFAREIIDSWIHENTQMNKCLMISASDDPLFREIVDLYNKKSENPAYIATVGSINALNLLKSGKANMSCVHVPDQNSEYSLSFLDRYLNRDGYVVIRLFSRNQGIILPQGNPENIKSFKEIFSKKLRFINRNPGSGTRIIIDHLLKADKINISNAEILADNALSHMGAAMSVLKEEADAAFGLEHVANLMGLSFIPVVEEPFNLVIHAEQFETRLIHKFVEIFDQATLPLHLQNQAGYNISTMGQVVWQPQ